MLTIFRYKLDFKYEVAVEMPKGARLLHLGVKPKEQQLSLWAMVDTSAPTETRKFCIAMTGQELPNWATEWEYIGTAYYRKGFVRDGDITSSPQTMIYHVFENK